MSRRAVTMKHVFVILVVVYLPSCIAYPTYVPTSVCEEMSAHHHHLPSQPMDATPYNITVSPGNYTTGAKLTVTIAGSERFTGFMVQARREGSSVLPYPIGTFKSPLPAKTNHMWCSGGEPMNTVSQNNPSRINFTSVTVTWVAPAQPAGNISFYLTIVKNFETFWEKQKSNIIIGPSATPTTPTLEANFEITKSGCGKTKGCYSEPPSCENSEDCGYLVTYKDNGDNIIFELSTSLEYASVGFNSKQQMNDTDAVVCGTSTTSVVQVRQYYLDYHRPLRHDLRSSSDIKYLQGVYNNGIVKCRFIRKKVPVAPKMRNFETTKLYFIFAWSKVSSIGGMFYHYRNASFTREIVDVTKPAILKNGRKTKPIPTVSPDEKITKTECGKTKGCYSEPRDCKTSDDCQYLLTYKSDKKSVTFEMSSKTGWVAVGFNSKAVMDGTDAIICSRDGGGIKIENYEMIGYSSPTKDVQGSYRLKEGAGKYDNGVLQCKVTRQIKEPEMMDLSEKIFLIFARGRVSRSGRIKKHYFKSATVEKVDISSTETLKAGEKNFVLIRAHAILMSIAWLVFASLGMFTARCMKPAWGDVCGKKAWFQVHRVLMVSTLVFTVIGVILAFVYAEGWSKVDDAHPIIGIIVLVLTVIQPGMALFRPAPGDDNRFLFNWVHRSVGLSALILAVTNCFLGVLLPHFDIKTVGLYPLIVYCVAGVFLVLVFEITLTVLSKRSYDMDQADFEMKNEMLEVETKKPVQPANQNKSARKIMFAFVVIVVSGSCLALIILLAGG